MKQTILGLCVMMIVLLTACEKNKDTTTPISSWTFKGVTLNPYTTAFQKFVAPPQFPGNYGLAGPTTHSNTDSNYAFLSIIFADSTGVASGTYTVIADDGAHPPVGQQVIIHLRYGPQTNETLYYATGGTGNQTVTASITDNGKLSVSGSNIELGNIAAPSDKSPLKFSMTAD